MGSLQFDFRNRTVLVTGAAQGIGHAIAQYFLIAGARVAAADNDQDRLEAAWAHAPEELVLRIAFDVAEVDAAAAAVDRTVAWGGLDVVVNNAGITRDGVVWKLSTDDWSDVLGVHLTGAFNVTRAAIPTMRAAKYGRIINVTSFTGLHGNIGQSNYASAKAGLIGFTKAVAKEVAGFGITVNAISPNAVTRMVEAIPADRVAELTKMIPLGRFGRADEMAPAVAFLASEEAGYITGAVLPIDGGMAM